MKRIKGKMNTKKGRGPPRGGDKMFMDGKVSFIEGDLLHFNAMEKACLFKIEDDLLLKTNGLILC